jgi:hypothetical protein
VLPFHVNKLPSRGGFVSIWVFPDFLKGRPLAFLFLAELYTPITTTSASNYATLWVHNSSLVSKRYLFFNAFIGETFYIVVPIIGNYPALFYL